MVFTNLSEFKSQRVYPFDILKLILERSKNLSIDKKLINIQVLRISMNFPKFHVIGLLNLAVTRSLRTLS